jgi:osmotically-inducible protein OsmY
MSSRDDSDYDRHYRGTSDRERDERYHSERDDRYRNDNDRNIWTRSVDEVRSWFGDEEAERRRLRDEEERMRNDQIGAYRNHSYRSEGDDHRSSNERSGRSSWDSSRGYGSNIDRDYGQSDLRSSRSSSATPSYFRSSNEYGGSRNRDFYRDYPTHNGGRSPQNNEDDEMKHGFESQYDYRESNNSNAARMFGGRDYERNYPTREERNGRTHDHDLSEGWQSNDSQRGYRSLNNTGRTGIGQDNQLGKDRSTSPNYDDRNYSKGDYTPNLNAGGQEYNSRHYEQRGRMGSAINDQAQRGYSQGYGRTGYSLDQQSGNYANGETRAAKHPKNYKRTDDRIYVEVCEALGRELDASEIEVTASGSEITLSGSVRDRDEKRRAERIAESVSGVEDVHNRLTVKQDTQGNSSPSNPYNSTSSSSYAGTSNGSSTDRSASQQGNSSRTDLAADGSSQTESRSGEGTTSSALGSSGGGSVARSTASNGSSRGSGRK